MATSGSSSSPYTFAATSGYRNDGDAGLTHVGARYYDAQVGRFITRDTELDQHPYLYCDHDPVNALDPSGHNRLWDGICKGWKIIKEPIETIHKWYERADWASDVIGLWGKWNQSLTDANDSIILRHMIENWRPKNDIDPITFWNAYQGHMRQSIGHLGETTGETAKFYYNNLYPPKSPL